MIEFTLEQLVMADSLYLETGMIFTASEFKLRTKSLKKIKCIAKR